MAFTDVAGLLVLRLDVAPKAALVLVIDEGVLPDDGLGQNLHGAPSYLVRGSYALNGTTYFPEMYPGILHGNQAGKLLVAY